MSLARFTEERHTIGGIERTVFCGGSGPGVLVMHEVPGLHPDVARFGADLIDAGFTVWMPVLFGKVGAPPKLRDTVGEIARACISVEFTTWRTGRNSPITDWLRGLARELSAHTGTTVGAVGMCLTGGFALALVAEDCVTAPVLSQPSLPFGVFPRQRRDLGIDAPTLRTLKRRVSEGLCVLGLRYRSDGMVPPARFRRLRRELGRGFEAIELRSGWKIWQHSVLAADRHDPTVHRVIAFFREHTRALEAV